MEILGLDIGGTGIKGAIVDTVTGELLTERHRELTPQPSTPENIATAIKGIIEKLDYKGKVIGVGFPTLIRNGVAQFATNIDDSWVDVHIGNRLGQLTGHDYYVANDADTAGLAEAVFGSTKDAKGLIIFLTIGTGIGSALIYNGQLIPNTEFGHINFKGDKVENYTSNKARKEEDLSWKEFGNRLNKFLEHLNLLFSPQSFILGGGISKKVEKYDKYLTVEVPVLPSEFLNAAGVIGAAYFAKQEL